MAQSDYVILGLNLIVCIAGILICIERMTEMSHTKTKLQIRVQYSLWFSLFIFSGFSWLFHDPADLTQLVMSLMILANLVIGNGAWRQGLPEYAHKPTILQGHD